METETETRHLYAIFDSLNRQCGGEELSASSLWGPLKALQEEAEEEGDGLTYAIARRPVGQLENWTFDF
jgi:hypothetical protein